MGWFCLVDWIVLVDVLANLFFNVLVDVLVDVFVGWLIWWLDNGVCFVQLGKHLTNTSKSLTWLNFCPVKLNQQKSLTKLN